METRPARFTAGCAGALTAFELSMMAQTQQISAEVLQWIVDQARAGHTQEAVLAGLRASGWSAQAAHQALSQTTQAEAGKQAQVHARVPGPDMTASSLLIRTSDRDVQVLATMRLPRVIVFGDLLSPDECDCLVGLARHRLQPSLTVDNWNGVSQASESRTSQSTYLARGQTPVVEGIEARIAELLNWPAEFGEGLEVLRYGPGDEFKPHYDYFEPSLPGSERLLERGGQRVATLVMYLMSPIAGGGTIFPDVALEVAPIKGNAVFFSYDVPHSDTKSLHGGMPVGSGEKWVATKWLRERALD